MPGWKKRPGVGAHSAHWFAVVRPAALARDGHRCTWIEAGARCTERATDVDRIISRGEGGLETLDNARSLCRRHHAAKSSAEGGRARRRRNRYEVKRKAEEHPAYRGSRKR